MEDDGWLYLFKQGPCICGKVGAVTVDIRRGRVLEADAVYLRAGFRQQPTHFATDKTGGTRHQHPFVGPERGTNLSHGATIPSALLQCGDTVRLLLLMMLAGCDFGAAMKVVSEDVGSPEPVDSGGADDADTGEPDTSGMHPSDVDDDGDGYTENDGDCDDADADVYPGVIDECDGIDSNCDGVVDDAAREADLYEPNDTEDFSIGELGNDDAFEADAFLHDGADSDRFHFHFSDGTFDFFTLRIDLEWDASDVMYVMTIEHLDTGEVLYNQFSTAGSRELNYEEGDTFLSADGGNYRVTISSDGSATCMDGYHLKISLDGLF